MKNTLLILALLQGLSAFAQTNDPYLSTQWWIKDLDNGGANIENAWAITQKNYIPKIAVIDSGLDVNHEDIKDKILINTKEIPRNGIDDDGNGYVDDYYGFSSYGIRGDLTPLHAHGTHVAGTILATHNNYVGIAGAAKYGVLIPIRFDIYDETGDSVAAGILYAIARGADVINISAGFAPDSPKMRAAVKLANEKNIIIVASAGNSSRITDSYPALYAKEFKNVITVAASNPERMMTSFSSYGKDVVSLFAPGSDIFAPVPKDRYDYMSGTSMSAPIVTGIVALVLSTHGPKAAPTMRERLIETCHRIEMMNGKVYSNGLVDAYNAITGQMSINYVWR